MKESKEGEDWFLLFREGNKDAFREAFDRHYRSILYFASSILQQDSFAEDITIETFRKAWENRDRFETPRHLENFLFFVTRNACISHLRSDRTYKGTRDEWGRLTAGMEETGSVIDREKIQALLIEKIHNYLEQLNGGNILRMSYLEGRSTREIAQELNITENNVYIIKSRALRTLRELMAKDNLLWLFILILQKIF